MEKKDTRLAIIQSAVEIFANKGYEKATVDEIAAMAKIAKGTIFYNFKSKEEIFFAIIEQGTQDFVDLIHERTYRGKTANEKMTIAYDTAFEFFSKYNHFCTILISELWRIRTRWNVEPTNVLDRFKQCIESIFIDGQKSGEFRKDIETKDIGLIIFFLAAVSSLSRAVSSDPNIEQHIFDRSRLILMKGISPD